MPETEEEEEKDMAIPSDLIYRTRFLDLADN